MKSTPLDALEKRLIELRKSMNECQTVISAIKDPELKTLLLQPVTKITLPQLTRHIKALRAAEANSCSNEQSSNLSVNIISPTSIDSTSPNSSSYHPKENSESALNFTFTEAIPVSPDLKLHHSLNSEPSSKSSSNLPSSSSTAVLPQGEQIQDRLSPKAHLRRSHSVETLIRDRKPQLTIEHSSNFESLLPSSAPASPRGRSRHDARRCVRAIASVDGEGYEGSLTSPLSRSASTPVVGTSRGKALAADIARAKEAKAAKLRAQTSMKQVIAARLAKLDADAKARVRKPASPSATTRQS